jgi:hypothetical protein
MTRGIVSSQEELHSMELVFKVLRLSQMKVLDVVYSAMNSETVYTHFIGILDRR